ncbi:MAG: 3-oxoacyl-ACP reductase FabG [Verrucomicrobiales bacterium]|nr:3-oxoacyl-ACP reductase FabG [Verrucomicrobiales bacterium]
MPDASLPLEGRVALVTGSSAGLGKAIAMGLAAAGARVGLNFAHQVGRAESALREMRQQGWVGALFQADVTREAEVKRLVNECVATLGPVDILVINATSDQPQRPVEEYDWAFVQQMLDYFVKSPFLLVQACLPHMKAQRWGRVINIGSEVVARGVPNFTAYVAAKGGQNGLHRSLATELAPHGITVNMIAPGWIPVERHAGAPQAEKEAYLAGVPAKRWGVPEDVAAAAVYLAGEGASFVTGQTLHVNGGLTVC